MRHCDYAAADAVVRLTDGQAQALDDALSRARAPPKSHKRNIYYHKPTGRWRVSRREGGRTITYASSANEEQARRQGEDVGVLVPVGRRARPPWILPSRVKRKRVRGEAGKILMSSQGSNALLEQSRPEKPEPQPGHDHHLLRDRVLLRMPAAAQALVRLRLFTQAYGTFVAADLSDLLDRRGPQNHRVSATKLRTRARGLPSCHDLVRPHAHPCPSF